MRRFIGVIAVLLACDTFAIGQPDLPVQFTDVREIRAGVICYGGVSLAIYMYGNARELHHLALASAALDCDAHRDDAVPPASCAGVTPGKAWDTLRDDSAKEYYVALTDLWRKDEVRPRFVIDVISGTSAGGINGVFLAKALTHNGPIDGLREIWFRDADINRLAGRPWPLRAAWRVLVRHKAALGGDTWLAELYRALKAMDARPDGPRLESLLVPGQPVDLLVTATDFYGSERVLEIGDPATSSELRYDHVFRFSAQRDSRGAVDPRTDAFDETIDNIALAFAARSSASFPVAFPAIQLDELHKALAGVVPDTDIRTGDLAQRLFADRLAEFDDPKPAEFAKKLFLVDGGVLNNYPFGIAHRRVSRRSPTTETTRVYLYLEPDPRVARTASPADADGPSALQMFWNAKTTIPGAQPISQELIDIAKHNRNVARIREIIRKDDVRAQKEIGPNAAARREDASVAAQVEGALGVQPTTLADPKALGGALANSPVMRQELKNAYDEDTTLRGKDPGLAQIRALRRRVEEDAAAKGLPLSEDAYKRLRVESVLDQFARVMTSSQKLCGMPAEYEGPRASLMQEIVHQWAAFPDPKHPELTLTGADANPQEREKFLDAFDLGYLRRRLRFVNDWLNLQYPKKNEPKIGLSRDQIQQAQAAIAHRVDDLSNCLRGACLDDVAPATVTDAKNVICNFSTNRTARDHATAILDIEANRKAITRLATELREVVLQRQDKLLSELYGEFVSQTGDWNNEEAARAVLSRYLGFPYWDRVAYPYTAFSGIGDMTQIDITRMSPNDTKSLSDLQAAKLKGAGLGHFGAFFSADGRQQDYVWGRLDGAERLLSVLGFKGDAARRTTLFTAIVNDEKRDAKVSTANLQSFCDKFGVCPSTHATPAKSSP